MNNYKKLFEQISPGESDETLVTKVLARKAELMKENNTKKTTKNIFLRKAVVIPAAAVLTLGTATLTVGAVNNWDYSKAFRGMFAAKYEGNVSVVEQVRDNPAENSTVSSPLTSSSIAESSPTSSSLSESSNIEYVPEKPIGTFDFEKYGKQLGIVLKGDGITATLDGMLVYDDLCYIMYTTEATDELLAKTGGEVPGLRIDFGNFAFKIDGKIAGGMGYKAEPISQNGNTKTGIIEIHYNSVDLAGKTLNIGFLSETHPGDPSTALINQYVDIPIDFKLSENIEKELNFKLKTDSFDGVINKIKVSGFKSTLYYSGKTNVSEPEITFKPEALENIDRSGNWNEIPYYYVNENGEHPSDVFGKETDAIGNAVVTLKDGTTVVAKNIGGRTHCKDDVLTGEIELRYTYPIDPADVSSITFGDYTINL